MRHAGKKALSTGGNVTESLKWEVFVTPGHPRELLEPAVSGPNPETPRDRRRTQEKCDRSRRARGLYDKMLKLYPDRVNPVGAIWLSARAVKP